MVRIAQQNFVVGTSCSDVVHEFKIFVDFLRHEKNETLTVLDSYDIELS